MSTPNIVTCPVCDSYNVEGDDWSTGVRDGVSHAWVPMTCIECGATWTDHYEWVGRQDITR